MDRRRTKIVVTLGPATSDRNMIEQLVNAQVDVVRLNFSHGSHEEHSERISLIREISEEKGHPVTLLQDLQGPKIRTGEISGGSINLTQGESLTLTVEPVEGNEKIVSVDFDDLPSCVQPGGRIMLDDGSLELVVVDVAGSHIETKCVLGGVLKSHKGVNLPGATLNIPAFTEKDAEDLEFGIENNIDAVAMSFVRTPADLAPVRQATLSLAPGRRHIPIIAKLERPEALENLHDIIRVSDG
jgi:pyruvate kinase